MDEAIPISISAENWEHTRKDAGELGLSSAALASSGYWMAASAGK